MHLEASWLPCFPEMRYCEISKEMSSKYFGVPLFCFFEATDPEFDTQPLPPITVDCTKYTVHWTLRQNLGL
jgi:hypothetical protein